MQPTTLNHLTALLLVSLLSVTARAAEPPFPDALAAADVTITNAVKMSDGLLVGNGELNAIVYVAGKDLMLRVSKNDVWDGRIDTSQDLSLPKVDPALHKLFCEKTGDTPSWKKPYPTGVPCGDIKLASLDGETSWTMNLSLAKAVATVTTSAETTTVRALAQANVFNITSRRKLELAGVPQKFLPAATSGEDGGIVWLCQSIPGNEDIKGMEVYLAAGTKGARQVVAVVTSTDTAEPRKRAVQLVKATLTQSDDEVVKAHEAVWTEFWAQSGLRLSEPQLQKWWYRMVYYFRCFAKKGATGVGLKTSFDGLAGWHNSYKFNYNIQQTYLSAGPINHPELVEPINRLYEAANMLSNFFCATRRLIVKERRGARYYKRYDEPATPCERVLAAAHLYPFQEAALITQSTAMDPYQLRTFIDVQRTKIFAQLR